MIELYRTELGYEVRVRCYADYDRQCGDSRERRLINGKRTSSGNCVGYCSYCGHEGFLTREQRRQHNCIGKGCDYYLSKRGA